MTESKRRRRRPAVSCTLCRRRKIRCNRESPCSNCLRSRTGQCVYDEASAERAYTSRQSPETSSRPSHLNDASKHTSAPSPLDNQSTSRVSCSLDLNTPSTHASAREIGHCVEQEHQLRDRPMQILRGDIKSHTEDSRSVISEETSTSRVFRELSAHRPGESSDYAQELNAVDNAGGVSRNTVHKNRVFGQSHWMNGVGLFEDLFGMIEPSLRQEPSIYGDLCKVKVLGDKIKSAHNQACLTVANERFPSRDVADDLVECYLRDSESIYRVLHVPTFRKEYEASWTSTPTRSFAILLKLVLAIGATTYDAEYSLRNQAARWVYEAHAWVTEPEFKKRLTLQVLQINILLLLGREGTRLGKDFTWILVGSLIRTAVYMGLHRDPSYLPKRSTLVNEMRRRLWNTLLEISVQSSMVSGAPPMISMDDFDVDSPRNFDDDQLMEDEPHPQSEDRFTDSSIAIQLRRSFPVRLAIAKYLNAIKSQASYGETLRLDMELRKVYKALRKSVQRYGSGADRSPSSHSIRMMDVLLNYYIFSLHIPFFGSARNNAAYEYSRKSAVECCQRVWHAVFPSTALWEHDPSACSGVPLEDSFARGVTLGFSATRTITFQAGIFIAMELRTQILTEESLGAVPVRKDLQAVLYAAKSWSLQCIEAGEVNVKGYLFFASLTANIEGLIAGFEGEKMLQSLHMAVKQAAKDCVFTLERKFGAENTEHGEENSTPVRVEMELDMEDGWEFENSFLHFDANDPVHWLL